MRTLLFLAGMAGAALLLNAQTNSSGPATNAEAPAAAELPAPVSTNAPGSTNVLFRAPTEIFSDMLDFKMETSEAVYSGHVRVIDPQMTLSCELLTVIVPKGGGRINRIVAETNVVIDALDSDGKPIHATGQLAVYTYDVANGVTNEIITLTGHPQVQSAAVPFSEGDEVIWNRGKGTIRVLRPHMLIQPPEAKDTNATPNSPKLSGDP